MVYRIYVEKKPELACEAAGLFGDLKNLLGIGNLTGLRVLNRYDAEAISEELFRYAVRTVFSEPQVDRVAETLSEALGRKIAAEVSAPADCDAAAASVGDAEELHVFAVEYLPGQFDQRADSAAQCIQIISQGERPVIRSAKVYALYGKLSAEELEQVRRYVINPVEAREAALTKPETLAVDYVIPETVEVLEDFSSLTAEGLSEFVRKYGLAMDQDDLKCCQDYFRSEKREPTITEIRMIDTYWSDHCRHTTFNTVIDSVTFEDETLQKAYEEYLAVRKELNRARPISLMDLGTIAAKALKAAGLMDKLDESEEINACTIRMEIETDGEKEPWLLLFKNETHNHPTEIEPFGGAATCIGGAIRDPLSGRSYVYAAMRLTGAGDPTAAVSETLPGKLPQRKLVTTAAAGYSSYGNQIGLATGMVNEVYHPGFIAKRMEVGAVIAAAPAENVRREVPAPGDVVIYLGGSTGRDGIGGATGSSKAHNAHSVETCGAEVQKGNAPEERKLQRLFRNPEASRMIKRCNDFGAGGVSVAIGELADGLDIDLNAVPRKYEGLDGTELAISESQERMAIVVAAEDADRFLELAAGENLQAVKVAEVKADPRLTMTWNGRRIVDISRAFLDTNGASKHIQVTASAPEEWKRTVTGTFTENLKAMAQDLNVCSGKGLSQRFDSTVGANTVLMPFGGKLQHTPIQAMVQHVAVEKRHTDSCSLMSWGYNPYISEKSPYHGAYLAVAESICRLVATGAEYKDVYLTFQEYFERLGKNSRSWGKPLSALLGAFRAQMGLGAAAIGGKDSMSGSFEDIHVPPTLISFAVAVDRDSHIISPECKAAGHKLVLLKPEYDAEGLPTAGSMKALFARVTELYRSGAAVAGWTPGFGGVAEGVMKMCFGNGFGFRFEENLSLQELFGYCYGAFLLEVTSAVEGAAVIGTVTEDAAFVRGDAAVSFEELLGLYEGKLEQVYPCNIPDQARPMENFKFEVSSWPVPKIRTAKPKVMIPAFPGTNCEYDSAKAMRDAGAEPEIFVVRNLTAAAIADSVEAFARKVREAQMIFIPGGFSGGDEPDGSGKFITAFFRNAAVKAAVTDLLDNREGLMCGICNGFQALIKLGLVPFGRIVDTDETCPTLTYNTIARHQSGIVQTRVASNMSPWLKDLSVGDIINVPISHGEGRFLASEEMIRKLAANGQIATQYVDLSGNATGDIHFNPNDSLYAIEGITSPDGRVFGKMGHCERTGAGLYRNVPGNYDMKMFEAAVRYFKG